MRTCSLYRSNRFTISTEKTNTLASIEKLNDLAKTPVGSADRLNRARDFSAGARKYCKLAAHLKRHRSKYREGSSTVLSKATFRGDTRATMCGATGARTTGP